MADCKLSLTLDDPQPSYRPGGRIEGKLRVVVDGECPCKGLILSTQLRATKHGRPAGELCHPPLQLFSGTWSPGEHVYPFTLTAPAGPPTYAGAHLALTWELEAQADIPWASDPKAQVEIPLDGSSQMATLVEPAATGAPRDVAADPHAGASQPADLGSDRGLFVALAIALLATAGGIWVYLEHGESDLFAVGGAVAGLLVVLLGFRHLERSGLLKGSKRPVPRHRRLAGWPQLGVLLADRDPYRSGGEQRAALACTLWVKADCPLLDVTATLTVIEEVHISHGTTGSGHSKGRDTFMEALHKNAVPLVPAGEAGVYHGRIPLPTGLPGSFEGDGAEIQWRVTAVGRPAEGSWTTSRGVTLKVR